MGSLPEKREDISVVDEGTVRKAEPEKAGRTELHRGLKVRYCSDDGLYEKTHERCSQDKFP